MILEDLVKLEEKEILREYNSLNLSKDDHSLLNQIAYRIHFQFINELISKFVLESCPEIELKNCNDFFEGSFLNRFFLQQDIDISNIPSLCENLHVEYLNSSFTYKNKGLYRKKSKENLIENGAVYTPEDIVRKIIEETLSCKTTDSIQESTILDFATGTGRFYRGLVKYLQSKFKIDFNYSILNILYAVDIDPIAVNICRINAFAFLNCKNKSNLKIISEHIICKNALIRDTFFDDNAITDKDCNGLFYRGFDIIVSNPPYLVLKPNRRKMDIATVNKINNLAKYFRKSPYYNYSIEGMLNLYQLSLESMINMLKTNGEMGIICPSTLFADMSSSKLRIYLLKYNRVSYIKYFSEDDPLFNNVTQATCIFHLTKGLPTDEIIIEQSGKKFKINLEDVRNVFEDKWEIPSLKDIEWKILSKINKFKRIKHIDEIRNKRGELDLSLYYDYITKKTTDYRLVRGNMIGNGELKDINKEYVIPSFLDNKSNDYKTKDFQKIRLICQQISNQTQRVRLRFVFSQKNDILANSCNYISANDIILAKLNIVLNSALLNWRFKITSTNNHINNYELDELPICDLENIKLESVPKDIVKRDEYICNIYGLNKTETKFIINYHYDIA